MWSTYTLCLIAFARGHFGQLRPSHAKHAWYLLVVMLIGQIALRGDDKSGRVTDFLGGATKVVDGMAVFYLAVRVMPIAGFALLLLSELATFLFSLTAPEMVFAYLRHPVMAVHAASLSYYIHEVFLTSRAMQDAFGRPLYPLRYLLWTCSVSSMFVSVYYVVESSLRTLRDPVGKLAGLHAELSYGLFTVNGMFTFGFLAGLQGPWGHHWNAVCFVASCYFFYGMIGSIDRMLSATQEAATIHHARGLAKQLQIMRIAIIAVWHVFPLVWALAACNAISIDLEHIGYIFGDLLAKYLLMFVYVSSVNNHATQRQGQTDVEPVALATAQPGVAPAVGVRVRT